MNRFLLACVSLCAVVSIAGTAFAQDAQTPDAICANAVPAAEPANRQFSQMEQVLEPGVDYRAILCTGVGAVYVDLLEDYAPITVDSFVFLAQQGYYNNTTFHRVIADFMAQGGDPTGTGGGDPGYEFVNEPVGFLKFDSPGWLAMANRGVDTNGSQFFITTAPYPSLDYKYTIFGEVLQGQENVENIQLRDPGTATEPGTALNTVVIITDPAAVETTYVAPAPASREDIGAVIDLLNSRISEPLALDAEASGIFETDQVAQSAPEALRGDYADFLAAHHHEFRAAHAMTNATCDLSSVPFMAVGYTLDRFETPEDAAAALDDGFYDQLAQANGYTASDAETLDYPLYTQPTTACNLDATSALTQWQHGHFVVTATVVFPADHPIGADRWLKELVGMSIYESSYADVLRRELR